MTNILHTARIEMSMVVNFKPYHHLLRKGVSSLFALEVLLLLSKKILSQSHASGKIVDVS